MIVHVDTPTGPQTCDLRKPISLAIPLKDGDENPNCYYAENPRFETIETEDFIGDVARGGSVNYQRVVITPHGNGTHTESVGHITAEKQEVSKALQAYHFLAELITLTPRETNSGMEIALEDYVMAKKNATEAVIVRTQPNGDFKKQAKYSGTNPPYLHPDVASRMVVDGVRHLLVDLPSIDPEKDEGRLTAHRNFWTFPRKAREHATITELIYVPDEIPDGMYLLGLYLPLVEIDAISSNPTIYKLNG